MSNSSEFIEFAIAEDVLRFGEFTLKSGRISPYFFNAGLFNSGAALAKLGRCYAQAIADSGIEFDMLFGPAYKGITLAAATSIAFATEHGRDLPYAYNRKEAKDHGEGGTIVGAGLTGRVLIIDDVITAGTAIREAIDIIKTAGAEPVGVAISIDRQERGRGATSAIQDVEEHFGLKVISIATLADLLDFARARPELASIAGPIEAYRQEYGV